MLYPPPEAPYPCGIVCVCDAPASVVCEAGSALCVWLEVPLAVLGGSAVCVCEPCESLPVDAKSTACVCAMTVLYVCV